jgi:hypothetical protein
MLLKFHRRSRRILMAAAALPLFQAAACDPAATLVQLGGGFTNVLATSVTQLFVRSTTQTLLNMFPGSNFLRSILLTGGFFPGFF